MKTLFPILLIVLQTGYVNSFAQHHQKMITSMESDTTYSVGEEDSVCNCLDLQQFKVKALHQNRVDLMWSTSTHLINDTFLLQKSADGVHFTDVAEVADYTSVPGAYNIYEFSDYDIGSRFLYYRLRYYNQSGHSTHSNIIAAEMENAGDIKFQNPVYQTLNISNLEEDMMVELFDVQGNILFSDKANTYYSKNISFIDAGLYILKIVDMNNTPLITEQLMVYR